jgi:hypothetical protein
MPDRPSLKGYRRTVIAEQKSNVGSQAPDKDIGKNLSQEMAPGDLDRRLDGVATSTSSDFGSCKAQDYHPAVGAEGDNDSHEAAVSKQP